MVLATPWYGPAVCVDRRREPSAVRTVISVARWRRVFWIRSGRYRPPSRFDALNRLCDRNVDASDVTGDGHPVRLGWILGRAAQPGSVPNVNLRPVQRARHRGAVERAFTQRTLSVRAPGLRRTEASFDVEHRDIAQQQDRSRRPFADAKLVPLERCVRALCGGCDRR